MDANLTISKSITSMLKTFLTRELAEQFTATKSAANKKLSIFATFYMVIDTFFKL